MKRLLTLCTALLLAFPLHAAEYANATVRFTLPDGFTFRPITDEGVEGFEATDGTLRLSLFTLRFPKNINLLENMKVQDIRWFPFLEEATQTFTHTPIGTRYERVSTYRQGDRYIRIYRYVAARSLCFLVAENTSGDWTEADRIAQSQRYQKNFAFYRHNFLNGLILFLVWCSIVSCACLLISNLIRKRRRRKFWYWIIPTLLVCAAGIALFGWPLSLESLTLVLWASAIVSSVAGGYDDSSGSSSEDNEMDFEDPSSFDGTGPTIHYHP